MDWFPYDRDLRHEIVKDNYFLLLLLKDCFENVCLFSRSKIYPPIQHLSAQS